MPRRQGYGTYHLEGAGCHSLSLGLGEVVLPREPVNVLPVCHTPHSHSVVLIYAHSTLFISSQFYFTYTFFLSNNSNISSLFLNNYWKPNLPKITKNKRSLVQENMLRLQCMTRNRRAALYLKDLKVHYTTTSFIPVKAITLSFYTNK